MIKVHGLPLARDSPTGAERRHDGRVAVAQPDTLWRSDDIGIGCDNGEEVHVTFALDCCGRKAISWIAAATDLTGSDIRTPMIESIEHRHGLEFPSPAPIEWLFDNRAPYIAREIHAMTRLLDCVALTTPAQCVGYRSSRQFLAVVELSPGNVALGARRRVLHCDCPRPGVRQTRQCPDSEIRWHFLGLGSGHSLFVFSGLLIPFVRCKWQRTSGAGH